MRNDGSDVTRGIEFRFMRVTRAATSSQSRAVVAFMTDGIVTDIDKWERAAVDAVVTNLSTGRLILNIYT